MGKASSSKKIRRVQQAGVSRAPGQRRNLAYPALIVGIIVVGTLRVATAIQIAAGLSFLGLGAQPPYPEWGAMLNNGRSYMRSGEWWMTIYPGLAIFITVMCINLLGSGLRDALDPRLRGSEK